MLTLSPAVRIYVATGATDLRRSIDGLAALVRERFDLDPLSGHLFLAPLQAIRDRNGNEIRLTWSDVSAYGSGKGNLLRLTSPNGRWIAFTYYPGTGLVQTATDNIGHTVNYTYDGSGRLWKVTDPLNHVTEYTYDTNHRMTTIKNRNGVEYVTNEYTTAADAPTPVGWVKKQTHADGGVYAFTYSGKRPTNHVLTTWPASGRG
jgi:YD repeat-containing protein